MLSIVIQEEVTEDPLVLEQTKTDLLQIKVKVGLEHA